MIKTATGNACSLSGTVKPWVLANLLSVFSATTISLVLCLGSPCIAESVTQEGGMNPKTKGTARITATPQRVKVSDGFADTDISWNTGDGSMGFVFVTATVARRFLSLQVTKVAGLSHGFGGAIMFSNSTETLDGGHCSPQ
jgi:hypothetical protein